MDSIDAVRASGVAKPSNPADDTVINVAPYGATTTFQKGPETHVDPPAGLTEEVRRRQLAIAARYVTVLRSSAR